MINNISFRLCFPHPLTILKALLLQLLHLGNPGYSPFLSVIWLATLILSAA